MNLEIALEASLLLEGISASMTRLEAILSDEGTAQQRQIHLNAVQVLNALHESMKGMNLRMVDEVDDARRDGHPSTKVWTDPDWHPDGRGNDC